MSLRIVAPAVLALFSTAGVASAQFFPRFGPQIPSGVYLNSPLGGYYFNTYQQYQFSYTGMVGGRPMSINFQYAWSGLPRNNYYYPTYGSPYGGSMGGGAGSFGSDQNNPIVERQRAAIARAQRNAEWDNPVAGRKDDIDNWIAAQSRAAESTSTSTGAGVGIALPIDPALIDPADEAILSGKALNELLMLCLKQEKDGRRAESGLCPPDLLERIQFAGGVASDGVNLFRQSSINYPSVVVIPETEKLRQSIDTPFAAISKQLRAGKRPTLADLDQLDGAVLAARRALDLRMKDAPFAESKEVNDFLNQLASAAKFARTENAPSAFIPGWNTTGATVAELIRQMDKFKLQFGQAPAGSEPAYLSLHRGLLGYYVRLTPAKK